MPDLNCWGGTIWTDGEYNPKSAFLKCKCGKTGWHTKNIGYIGARNIYFFAGGCDWMNEKIKSNFPECSCPVEHLSIDEELMKHVQQCERCRQYGF